MSMTPAITDKEQEKQLINIMVVPIVSNHSHLHCQSHIQKIRRVIYRNTKLSGNRNDIVPSVTAQSTLGQYRHHALVNLDQLIRRFKQQFVKKYIIRIHFASYEELSEQQSRRNNSQNVVNNHLLLNKRTSSQKLHKTQREKRNIQNPNIIVPMVTRKDSKNKQIIICGCGKKYSRFSSFYSHISLMHEGIPPENSKVYIDHMQLSPLQQKYPPQNQKFNNIQLQGKITHLQNYEKSSTVNHKQISEQSEQEWSLGQESEKDDRQGFCEVCGRQYSSRQYLKEHIKVKHPEVKHLPTPPSQSRKKQNIYCVICGVTVNSRIALQDHIVKRHQHKFQEANQKAPPFIENICQTYYMKCGCGRIFNSKHSLNVHIRQKHGGIKPAGSTQARAQKTDYSQSSLPKPYKCGCGKAFTASYSLNYHIRNNHSSKVPPGTIGGLKDRTKYKKQDKILRRFKMIRQNKSNIICSECGQNSEDSFYFQCKFCLIYVLCDNCSWDCNNLGQKHEQLCKGR